MAVTNDMVTDRRVQRHAATLKESGYDVVVLGRKQIVTRHAHGWRFYYEYNIALRRAVAGQKPDIVWANDTDTLLGCWLAARRCRAKLVMDAHELFPEVPEIQHKPLVKWVWRTLERKLMPKCDALLTVCDSIAGYYKERYGVEMAVVRNIRGQWPVASGQCAMQDCTSQLNTEHLPLNTKTLLYQGHVNLGRGVDWAIDALEWLEDCLLVVAGDGDLLEQMKTYAASKPWADRVTFLGRQTPDALQALTAKADVGLVMLEDMGLSYHYALPNRIGDFVQAGVPMVVSDLPEMATVVMRYRIGEVMRAPGARALADSIKKVLACGKEHYDFSLAQRDMDWNKEKHILIKTANKLCSTTSF